MRNEDIRWNFGIQEFGSIQLFLKLRNTVLDTVSDRMDLIRPDSNDSTLAARL